jgi:anti-sigma factor RsiW
MGCREWETGLTDWVLDELSPLKARQLEEHIGECKECARSAQRLRGVRQALMNGLPDRNLPAHLVLVGEKPQRLGPDFWTALLRTAALSAAAAVIFLAVAWAGFRYGGSRLLPAAARVEPTLTRTELQALIAQVVADQASLQRKEIESASMDLAASLRAEQMRNLASLQQQLQYLELAQNTVWKETQRQNAVIRLVARSQIQPLASSSAQPSRR